MSVESILKRDGINIIDKIDTLKVNTIAKNIADKVSSALPEYGLDKESLFVRLCRLDMYHADLGDASAEAKYFYKNSSIYFKKNADLNSVQDYLVHESIHFLQEVKDRNGNLLRMGLCDYSDFKTTGLALNEAAVQLLASKIVGTEEESVKYYGIDFLASSPTYYPLECALVRQMAQLVGEDVLFKSTLFSTDDFKNKFSEATSPQTYATISRALDELLEKEQKILEINEKISHIDDRNKKVDHMIRKISELKDEIAITFFRTQNLIFSSYFDTKFDNITNTTQVEIYRKQLYSYRDLLGSSDGYTYFDNYYIEKISALNHKVSVIENGGMETAINIRISKTESIFMMIINKIKKLVTRNARETNTDRN